jgi:hypothetical protein
VFLDGETPPAIDEGAVDAVSVAELERRLARLEAQQAGPRLEVTAPSTGLGDLAERVARLEARAAAPAPTGPAAPPPPTPPLQDLSDKDLITRARGLTKDGIPAGKDAAEALLVWKEILSRRVDDALRREGLMATGFAHRVLKQHTEEEAAFREVLRSSGSDETAAQQARYQIAWAQSFRGEVGQARDTMTELTRIGGGSKELVGHARLYEAHWSLELEDPARAREVLEGIVRDLGSSSAPGNTWLVEQAKDRLRRIEGR